MTISELPGLNACLNSLSALLLVSGYIFIRRRNIRLHRICMIAAFCSSILFLISYLFYHYHAGSTRFTGTGGARMLYFVVLLTHTILAVAVPPLALVTLMRALRNRIERHVKIARWTLPIWLYVSITGVVVYWMLYRMSW